MKELLFDVLLMSDTRKDLLLLLKDGPKDEETITENMGIERRPLDLQAKILEDEYLITRDEDSGGSYMLTTIGKLLVEEMEPLLKTFDVLDANEGYWEKHRLDFLPRNLLERLQELGPCTIVEPRLSEYYEFDKTFQEKSRVSSSFFMVTACFHPMLISLFSELLDQKVDISVIFSHELFEKMLSEQYSDFKCLAENKQIHFYIYQKDMHFLSFMENDYCVQFMLLTNENYFDNKQSMSCSQNALKWGKEFFEHYKKDSLQIEEI
ncbi:winged helix-turn-helix domain-containing protein [Methanolobus sp. ZRKC2]|uniref:helix-turn-helix transcriptional regulator n=1 Tax=Methanolobus sp. ZRKC2 TaxID=3125783 RepID=UPI0032485C32